MYQLNANSPPPGWNFMARIIHRSEHVVAGKSKLYHKIRNHMVDKLRCLLVLAWITKLYLLDHA